MRFTLAALGLTLAGTLNAAALDVRPASEAEILLALQGCWEMEPTFAWLQRRRVDDVNDRTICFRSPSDVTMLWMEGNPRFGGLDGGDGGGAFAVSNGKVRLQYGDSGGVWFFEAVELECDVIMNPGRSMKLTNCVGLGEDTGKTIADSSYQFRDD